MQKKILFAGNIRYVFLPWIIFLGLFSISGCGSNDDESLLLKKWEGNEIVETQYGAVKGYEDEAVTWVWKAIPFAKPPEGDLRWKTPEPPESWRGTRDETTFCSPCSQYDQIDTTKIVGSEDCLYLNVWRPRTDETDLPVYVWIHGGGNSIGSSTQTPGYYGADLAGKSNMVFVSMNYRLGPLGWFTHPSLRTGTAGDEESDSGNFGTLDIIESLKWIRDNIEAFGGDPGRVLISGESAGARNVMTLLISPAAENLFHTALSQSGQYPTIPVSVGEASANEVILKLLVNDGTTENSIKAIEYLADESNADIEAYLREKSPEDILACYDQMGWGMIEFIDVFEDGHVIASSGFKPYPEGQHLNKVPVILGSNAEETKIFMFMDSFFSGKDDLYSTVAKYSSDLWKVSAVDDIARILMTYEDHPGVYAYLFNWGSYKEDGSSPIPEPYDFTLGSAHSFDIPFFMGNEFLNGFMDAWIYTEENLPGRQALSDAMMAYVSVFARTGAPNASDSDLPEWKLWTTGEGEPKCILFDTNENNLKISMSSMELTISGILNAMDDALDEPLYSDTMDYLSDFIMVSHLMEY